MEDSNKKYLMYAVMFVVLLIIVTVTSTYAYFQVSVTGSIANSTITTITDCIDISIANDSSGNISLPFNYPVTDSYATSTITNPIEVQVKNNCNNKVSYSLILTTLTKSGESSIASSKIRYQVKKKIGTGGEIVWKKPNYLTSLQMLPTGNTTSELLNKDLDSKSATSSYTDRESYVIDGTSIEGNTTNTYKIYLWVDYYEGDTGMYDLSTGEEKSGVSHQSSYDNSTKGQTFKSAISIITNLGDTIIEDLSGNGNVGIAYNIVKLDNEGITTSDENKKGFVDVGLANYDFKNTVSIITRVRINSDVANQNFFNNFGGAGLGFSYRDLTGGCDNLCFTAFINEYRYIKSSTDIKIGTWYTLVATYDGQTIKIYINGVETTNYPITGNIKASVEPIYLGANPENGVNYGYAQSSYTTFSDALIFDRALSESEIKANYTNIPNPVDKSNLLLWYKFTK